MKNTNLPGARESNAGDAFHVLWAARRALHMLGPQSKLTHLLIEKVSDEDQEASAPAELFLGADVTEYEGGNTFQTATHTTFTQLKYSVRHPDKEWTVARLCERRSKNGPSVASRFAELFRGFEDTGADPTGRLRISLVSNQPVSDKLSKPLEEIRSVVGQRGRSLTTAALKKLVTSESRALLDRLKAETGLPSKSLPSFLASLDFSGCGSERLAFLEIRLVQSMQTMWPGSVRGPIQDLCELIRQEAGPEGRRSHGISKDDVLARLDTRPSTLFPASSKIKPPANLVGTKDARDIADSLKGAPGSYVVHGEAGAGKSTSISQLQDHLPEESVVIVFDCFADGSYLNPSEARHLARKAVVQVINELATRTDSVPLLRVPPNDDELYEEFEKRLATASEIVASRNGLLVLVIDAADNAVYASTQRKENCFVPDIWKLSLPESIRLVMSCRTHRINLLEAPTTATRIPLSGFSKENTLEYARAYLPTISEEEAEKFHQRTAGNPRLQMYLLKATVAQGSGAPLLTHTALLDLYEELYKEACRWDEGQVRAELLVAAFAAMTPPVPVGQLAKALRVEESQAEAFFSGFAPGMQSSNGILSSLDEDFDTFIREKPSAAQLREAHQLLATYLAPRANSDDYAARNIGRHLEESLQHEKLMDLALSGSDLLGVSSEADRNEVWRGRIAAALRLSTSGSGRTDAVKLMLVAAEAGRENIAIDNIIRENPDLAFKFASPGEGQRYFERTLERSDKGPWCFREASRSSKLPEGISEAESRLEEGLAWVRERARLNENERYGWNLSARDVAHAVDAVNSLKGPEAALSWLVRWRPMSFVVEVAHEVAKLSASRIEFAEALALLEPLNVPAWVIVSFAGAFLEAGKDIPDKDILRLAPDVMRNPVSSKVWAGGEVHLTAFLERFAALEEGRSSILQYLEIDEYSLEDDFLPISTGADPWSSHVRRIVLHAALSGKDISAEGLLPERYRKKEKGEDHYRQEREWFLGSTRLSLPLAKLRAERLVGLKSFLDLRKQIEEELVFVYKRDEQKWGRPNTTYYRWGLAALRYLEESPQPEDELRTAILKTAQEIIPGAWHEFAIDASERLLTHSSPLLGAAWLRASLDSDVILTVNAKERSDLHLRSARYVADFDQSLAKSFYGRAIETMKGINDDTAHLLRAISEVALKSASSFDPQQRPVLAGRLIRLLEQHFSQVSEKGHLPFGAVIRAVARLDLPSGLALISLLDERDDLPLSRGVSELLTQAGEDSLLTPEQCVALSPLRGRTADLTEVYEDALEAANRSGPGASQRVQALLRQAAIWCQVDCPLDSRKDACARIVSWASTHGAGSLEEIALLRTFCEWLEESGVLTEKEQPGMSEYRAERDKEAESLEAAWRTVALDSVIDSLTKLYSATYDRKRLRGFLQKVRSRLLPNERVSYLEILSSVPSHGNLGSGLVEEILDAFTDWEDLEDVSNWSLQGLDKCLRRHIPELPYYDYEGGPTLGRLLNAIRRMGKDPVLSVMDALASQIEEVSVVRLYALHGYVAGTLTSGESRDILAWLLDRTEERLKLQNEPLTALPSHTKEEATARLLFTKLGNPDKRVRWLGLHAVRRLLALPGQAAFLKALLGLHRSADMTGFADTKTPFYRLAASHWLFMALEISVRDGQKDIPDFLDFFEEVALSTSLPHVAIRELSRSIALSVIPPDNAMLARREALLLSNRPRACFAQRESSWSRRQNRARKEKSRRFAFNEMDTTRYWFPSVSGMFGYPDTTVEEQVEHFICDHWGITNDEVDSVMKGYWRDRPNWEERSNSHGTQPLVEDYRTYLEFNGMQCALGSYADDPATPILVDEERTSEESWGHELSNFLPHLDPMPLSDLRVGIPLRRRYWKGPSLPKDWKTSVLRSFYYEELAPYDNEEDEWVVVASDVDLFGDGTHQAMRLVSALVTPRTASSLMLALDGTTNNDFGLPIEEFHHYDLTLWEKGFNLLPFLTTEDSDTTMDKFDPFLVSMEGSQWRFAKEIAKELKVTRTSMGVWRDSEELVIAKEEYWAEGDFDSRRDTYSNFGSKGKRLLLRRQELLSVLAAAEMDLIVTVDLTLYRSSRYRDEGESYEPGITRTFILRANGKQFSVDGDFVAGRSDSEGADPRKGS